MIKVILRVLALGPLLAGCATTPCSSSRNYTEKIGDTRVTFDMVHLPGDGAAIQPFWIGRTEVTWDEFELYYLSEETDSDAVARPSPAFEPPDHGMGQGKHPATSLRRHAAEKYCEWLSKKTGKTYRLPTEAEWQFACGPAPKSLDEAAWTAENSGGRYHEVGTKKPNLYGLYDMLGNVMEYCSGPEPILRGGSWNHPASEARPDSRQKASETWSERDPDRPRSQWWFTDAPFVGFRVCRSE